MQKGNVWARAALTITIWKWIKIEDIRILIRCKDLKSFKNCLAKKGYSLGF